MSGRDVLALRGPVTVRQDTDGTWFVYIGETPFTRWPTQAMAEARAEAVRRYDSEVWA